MAKATATTTTTKPRKAAPTVAQLNSTTDSILTTVENVGTDIQLHLVALAAHVIRTGDVMPMGRFLIGLSRVKDGKSYSIIRADAARSWAKEFGFTLFRVDKNGAMSVKLDKRIRDLTGPQMKAHIAKMHKTKWQEFKADASWRQFDLIKRLQSIMESAKDALADKNVPEGKAHNIPSDLMEKLAAIVPAK